MRSTFVSLSHILMINYYLFSHTYTMHAFGVTLANGLP